MPSERPRFHLAIPVDNLARAREFYGGLLQCPEGRSTESWIDFDLYGHQIVTHLRAEPTSAAVTNSVDSHDVPVPHFGLILTTSEWAILAEHLSAGGTEFIIDPHTRFEGQVGEQSTMFLLDPSGNALEFKSFADDAQVFAS